MSRYLTMYGLALMSSDVYRNNQSVAFRRLCQESNPNGGFLATAYVDDRSVIVAIRGTQEKQDFFDDARMIPIINGATAKKAMEKMIAAYVEGYPQAGGAGAALGSIVQAVFNNETVDISTKVWANRIPSEQAEAAVNFIPKVLKFCKSENLTLRGFTGHSLGGALAQFLSEQTGPGGRTKIEQKLPAVVFNSPYMGELSGMRYNEGGGILTINARLDPLSYLTREVGNKTHSTNPNNIFYLETNYPPPPAFTTFSKLPFFKWLGGKMLHNHSILTMLNRLENNSLGKRTLLSFFPKVFENYWD